MNEKQILNSIISGLMEIPLPKDGKSVGIGNFKKDIKEAFKLARNVQFSCNIKEMREAYLNFNQHVERCK